MFILLMHAGTFLIMIKHKNKKIDSKIWIWSNHKLEPCLKCVFKVSKCEVLCWVMANIGLKRLIGRLNLIYIISGQFNLIKYADYWEYQGPDKLQKRMWLVFKRFSFLWLNCFLTKLPDTGSGELKTEENASKL